MYGYSSIVTMDPSHVQNTSRKDWWYAEGGFCIISILKINLISSKAGWFVCIKMFFENISSVGVHHDPWAQIRTFASPLLPALSIWSWLIKATCKQDELIFTRRSPLICSPIPVSSHSLRITFIVSIYISILESNITLFEIPDQVVTKPIVCPNKHTNCCHLCQSLPSCECIITRTDGWQTLTSVSTNQAVGFSKSGILLPDHRSLLHQGKAELWAFSKPVNRVCCELMW